MLHRFNACPQREVLMRPIKSQRKQKALPEGESKRPAMLGSLDSLDLLLGSSGGETACTMQ